mmetsp:Transcript_24606/g.58409  ORF Transcript_24606/g.58409 Transcript_24606/m.58409 type:complete len:255 (-) Transcript_24606:3097-3861(-)
MSSVPRRSSAQQGEVRPSRPFTSQSEVHRSRHGTSPATTPWALLSQVAITSTPSHCSARVQETLRLPCATYSGRLFKARPRLYPGRLCRSSARQPLTSSWACRTCYLTTAILSMARSRTPLSWANSAWSSRCSQRSTRPRTRSCSAWTRTAAAYTTRWPASRGSWDRRRRRSPRSSNGVEYLWPRQMSTKGGRCTMLVQTLTRTCLAGSSARTAAPHRNSMKRVSVPSTQSAPVASFSASRIVSTWSLWICCCP